MPVPLHAVRALTRFRCIAERCEDTCCSGLTIPVDEAWILRAGEALRREGDGAPLPILREGAETFLRPTPGGSCAFFGADRLCSLQRRFGADALPDPCARFPRVVTRLEDRAVLTGSLACPEVARQVLLADDALELELTGDPASESESESARPAPTRWREGRGLVDQALRSLLSRTGLSLRARLGLVAQLAAALEELPPGTNGGLPAEAVAAVTEHFLRRDVQDSAAQELDRLSLPAAPTLALYVSLFEQRRTEPRGARFDAFADAVLRTFAGLVGEGGAAEELEARRAWLRHRHGSVVERAFDNAVAHHLTRHAWLEAPTLQAWALRLAFRVGLVWTGLLAHPAVAKRDDAPAEIAGALVEAFQLTARHLEQAAATTRLLEDFSRAPSRQVLGRTLIFAAY